MSTIKRRGLVGALLLLLLLPACHRNQEDIDFDIIHNPNSANGVDESEKMPAITFDQNMHDFGRLTSGENISYSFKFTNTGSADLVISSCDASCGCTVADYPKHRVKPGESGYITVSFRSTGRSGQQVQEVTVSTNAQPSKTKLRIRAEVV